MKRNLRLRVSFLLCALLAWGGVWALAEGGVSELFIDGDVIEIEEATSDGGDALLEEELDFDNQDDLVFPDDNYTEITLPDIELSDLDAQDMEFLLDQENIPEASDFLISNPNTGDIVLLDNIKYEITSAGAVAKGVADGATGITEITFPAYVSGYALIRIDSRAFYQCDGLMKVTVPGNVKVIGDSAFQDCDSLSSVVLEAGVEEIGSNAFNDCNILTSLTMNPGLKTIKDRAFIASPIEELLFPDTVTSLSSGALNGGGNSDRLHASLKKVRWPAGVSRIPNNQFGYFSALETIVIPDNLTNFGDSSFSHCSNLSAVNFPDAVTSIGSYAFDGCMSLKAVSIPVRIMSISSYAFHNSGLEAVTIPGNVKIIGDQAFYDCDELASVVLAEGVEEIGSQAFANCDKLSSLTMAAGLKTIKGSAFVNSPIESLSFPDTIKTLTPSALNGSGNCLLHKSLKKVVWPASLTTIPKSQFSLFTALEEIVIPDTVTDIEANAFEGCSAMKSVRIPTGMTSINSYVFYNCGLQSVTISAEITAIGEYAFYNSGLLSVSIPGNVKTIGRYAFNNSDKLASVELEAGVEEIGVSAFAECDKLTSLTMGSGLKTINELAFIGSPITELSFPDTVTELARSAIQNQNYQSSALKNNLLKVRWTAGIATIPENQFLSFNALREVTIPEGVTTIGKSAFGYCSSLQTVGFPKTLTTIGENAFYNSGLPKLTVPGNVKTIGTQAFYDCNNLAKVVLEAGVEEIGVSAFAECDKLTSLTMGSGLKTINELAFIGSPITELSFPDTVTELAWSAIQNQNHQSSALKNNLLKVRWTAGIATIPEEQFSSFKALKEVTIPEGVTTIGKSAFRYCSSLQTVGFPKTLTTIGENAFYNSGLPKLTVPGNVKTIGTQAFYDCNNLAKVVLEAGVKEIGVSAFAECDKLTSLTMGSGLKTINELAFIGSPIKALSFPDTVTELARSAIQSSSDSVLKNNLLKVRWTAGIATIPEGQFSSFKALKEVMIPKGVKSIENSAFSQCSNLESVTLPGSVKSIGNWAFSSCGFKQVTVPGSVKTIGYSAFYNCDNMIGVVLKKGVAEIGGSAFLNCDNLKSVTMNEGLKKVGPEAFSCSPIQKLLFPDTVTSLDPKAINRHNPTEGKDTVLGGWIPDNEPDKIITASLKEVRWPAGVPEIPEYQFYGFSKLKTITLPNGVKQIDGSAFSGCTSLRTIIVSSTKLLTIQSSAFPNEVISNATFAVPNCKGMSKVMKYLKGLNYKVSVTKHAAVVVDPAIKATYTKTGLTEGKHCKECGEVLVKQKVVPKLVRKPKSVKLNKKGTVTLAMGDKLTLKATVSPKDTTTKLTWSSSNKKVATVDKSGVVTPVAKGTATITVKTSNKKTASVKVKVVGSKPKSVTIKQGKKATMKVGEKLTLKAVLSPAKADTKLTWSTSNKKVLTVSGKGVVTAVKTGTATVTVKTSNGKTASIVIRVQKQRA